MEFLDKQTRKELNKEEILKRLNRASDNEVTYEDIMSLIEKDVLTRITFMEKMRLCNNSMAYSLEDTYRNCILVGKEDIDNPTIEKYLSLVNKYGNGKVFPLPVYWEGDIE